MLTNVLDVARRHDVCYTVLCLPTRGSDFAARSRTALRSTIFGLTGTLTISRATARRAPFSSRVVRSVACRLRYGDFVRAHRPLWGSAVWEPSLQPY